MNYLEILNKDIEFYKFKIKTYFVLFILIALRFTYLIELEIVFVISCFFQIVLLRFFFINIEKTMNLGLVILHLLFFIFYFTDSSAFFQENTDTLTKTIYCFSVFLLFISQNQIKFIKLLLPLLHCLSFSFYFLVILNYKEIYKIDYELFLKLNLLLISPFIFLFFHFIFIFKSYYNNKKIFKYFEYSISKYILIIGIFLILFSCFTFYNEWKRIYTVFQTFKILRIEQNNEITKIPDWLSLSLKLEKNFTLYEFLNQKEKKNFILTKIIRDTNWNYPLDINLVNHFYFYGSNKINQKVDIDKISTEIFYKKNFFEVKIKFILPNHKNQKLFIEFNKESVIQNKYKNIKKLNSYSYEIDFKNLNQFELVYFQKNIENQFKGFELINTNENIPHEIKFKNFKEIKINSKFYHIEKDFQDGNYLANGKFISNWTIQINDDNYQNLNRNKVQFDEIVFLMNDTLTNQNWLKEFELIQKSFSNKKIHILSNSWFTPRSFQEAKENILNSQNPKLHLIPFNLLDKKKTYLIITNETKFSIDLKNLKPSYYYLALIDYFKLPKRKLFIYNLNFSLPSYIKDLINYEFIHLVRSIEGEFYFFETKLLKNDESILVKNHLMYNFISENSTILEEFKYPQKQKESFKEILHEFE